MSPRRRLTGLISMYVRVAAAFHVRPADGGAAARNRRIFGDEAEINTVILNLEDNSNAACEATMEEMLKLHGVSAASRTADVKDTYCYSVCVVFATNVLF